MQPFFNGSCSSAFQRGIERSHRVFELMDADMLPEVRRNPWNFSESVFDLNDDNFTDEERAGYIVGFFTLAFAGSPVAIEPTVSLNRSGLTHTPIVSLSQA